MTEGQYSFNSIAFRRCGFNTPLYPLTVVIITNVQHLDYAQRLVLRQSKVLSELSINLPSGQLVGTTLSLIDHTVIHG